jgi:hypothetical protein
MFSLIITIISIALVATLALATLYYGGDAFNQGRAGAEASKLINEGQQINASVALAQVTDVRPLDTLADLALGNVLTQLPQSFSGSGTVAIAGPVTATAEAATCAEVQKRAGVASPFDSAPTIPDGQMYGCTVTGEVHSFYFKL